MKEYDYVDSPDVIRVINEKLDMLTEENRRRFEGEFYTPLIFAKKAIHYLESVLGNDWYKSGKFRIWDMAAGTGNLEYHLPAESYKYLYLSTLHNSEVDNLKKIFPGSTCFQYDYLNDDVNLLFYEQSITIKRPWKMPDSLKSDLKNPDINWIVFINPPFATAQDARADGVSKKGVSKTNIEKIMFEEKIKHAKRELFIQFMFRISKEMPKNTYLGIFSTLKYLNAPDSIDFRDCFFNYKFEKGFLFHSKAFQDITGSFPIGFLIWNLAKQSDNRTVEIDILDKDSNLVGVKHLRLIKKNEVLNNWFPRPKNSDLYIMPPLSNGITVKSNNVDKRHRSSPDFLASICSNGNDFQHSKYVTILSSPNASAGAFTVNEDNFEKSLVLHAVKKIPKHTWLNDRNQFLTPTSELSSDFIQDCVIWSLFSNSNETTSLMDVEYLGKLYDIKNNFFPFLISEVKNWVIKDPDFKIKMLNDYDRFVAKWLHSNRTLSFHSQIVLDFARSIYKIFYSNLNFLITKDMKIDSWDAGWVQIRRCLAKHNFASDEFILLSNAHNSLARKIEPFIYEYGFLDKDEFFE
jgi:hypothetical protein